MILLSQIKKKENIISVLLPLVSAVKEYLDLQDLRQWLLSMLLGNHIVILQDGVKEYPIKSTILKEVNQYFG
jgi:hypothetical protein